MDRLPLDVKLKAPFLVAAFLSFLFSVNLYFIDANPQAGIVVGLMVPSIQSRGTLLLAGIRNPDDGD